MKDAVEAGTNSIEHGSMIDAIPRIFSLEMKDKDIAYDPTLSVFEGIVDLRTGNRELLEPAAAAAVGPADLIDDTRDMLQKAKRHAPPDAMKPFFDRASNEICSTPTKRGVMLITGSDAGNMLVIHGPTVQHEMELWVKAGIPPAVALQAATYNAAKVLARRRSDRADPEGPRRDIHPAGWRSHCRISPNTERISHSVVFRGEQVDRVRISSRKIKIEAVRSAF